MTVPKWRATNFLQKINVLKRKDVEGTTAWMRPAPLLSHKVEYHERDSLGKGDSNKERMYGMQAAKQLKQSEYFWSEKTTKMYVITMYYDIIKNSD